MPLIRVLFILSISIMCTHIVNACTPTGNTPLIMDNCSDAASGAQQWVLPDSGIAGNIHLKLTYAEGECIDAGNNITLQEISPSRQGEQNFRVKIVQDKLTLVHIASGLCIGRGSHRKLPLKLTACDDAAGSIPRSMHTSTLPRSLDPESPSPYFHRGHTFWKLGQRGQILSYANLEQCISACKTSPSPRPSPPPDPSTNGTVIINGSNPDLRYDGIWAMSANGAARQLYEYPEPVLSEILNLECSEE